MTFWCVAVGCLLKVHRDVVKEMQHIDNCKEAKKREIRSSLQVNDHLAAIDDHLDAVDDHYAAIA